MEAQVHELQSNMKVIQNDLKYIKESLSENASQHKELASKIDNLSQTFQTRIGDKVNEAEVRARFDEIDHIFVTKEAFGPVQKIVYGLAGGILIAFLGAIVALLFQ